MHPFRYVVAEELDEVRSVLRDLGRDAKVLAGGQSLMILLRQGLVSPDVVVGLTRIPSLKASTAGQDGIAIGAMVTYGTTTKDATIRAAAPILSRAASSVGSVHIRNLGTIGGSVCHADPAGDVPTVLLALDAVANASSTTGSSSYPLEGFFTELFGTQLGESEVLESINIPAQPAGASYGYRRFSYREGEYPLAVAATRLEWDDGVCIAARVAVGGGDVSPKRLPVVEAALAGTTAPADTDVAVEGVRSSLEPIP